VIELRLGKISSPLGRNLSGENMMTNTLISAIPATAEQMQTDGADVRILRRVAPLDLIPCATHPRMPFMTVAVIDLETTGFDPAFDEVIEVAAVLLRIDAFGRVVELIDSVASLRNPGFQIPQEIVDLTGITDNMVADVAFDPAPFLALLQRADVILAHNAEFDAGFAERLLPEIAGSPWACSVRQFDWRSAGFDGASLGYLLTQVGRFNNGHRAMDDVTSLVHVLTFEPTTGGTILAHIIKAASAETIRIEATGAPFEKRAVLKAQGYRWDPTRKVWWAETSWLLAPLEEAWLREEIVPQRCVPHTYPVTWRERFRRYSIAALRLCLTMCTKLCFSMCRKA